ncbi:cryptochrome/photolyase family protein [Exiguobacterium antarcticum]|uniref:Deoxyribodipyrimidine photo-lyase n=1 Tax=Exiguobacterium antarcticum TaxID=132920 RepID=A0ABT6QYH3_9BACL|nr:deoxyribodipyrimidine photo-lyase [Exiguobacterium antarcticum]AFS70950.1 Deoxyribodipyrimidine photo-lyase [Exiguobacterium antarcticum B7]MDI3233737.1 deoxyribodipyrimidine photo-lyase [Exiguobacterium antarcticum]
MNIICWIRSDFRIEDNHMLAQAAQYLEDNPQANVEFVFWINPDYIGEYDARQQYFFQALEQFAKTCKSHRMPIRFIEGDENDFLEATAMADLLLFNAEYVEPFKTRDDNIIKKRGGKKTERLLDRHLLHPHAVKKNDGSYYKVFTPYKNAFLKKELPVPYSVNLTCLQERYQTRRQNNTFMVEYFKQAGSDVAFKPGEEQAKKRLDQFLQTSLASYEEQRDVPSIDGTSLMSRYLRTGEIGIRTIFEAVSQKEDSKGKQTYITELIWREFYYTILLHYPEAKRLPVNEQYTNIEWEEDEKGFQAWCEGKTGYPIVDAAMRQLNTTGWMHNRLRMIVASFLTKDLLIDWQKGERYFQQKLVDYEAASNIGGWQWAASVGTDAVPYFRVFNPTTQSKKFDKDGTFIRQYVPEIKELSNKYIHEPTDQQRQDHAYLMPIVDHDMARKRAIARFK